jgi:hypothetical protein
MPVGFPRSIFAYWNDGGMKVIESAVRIMTCYKRKDQALQIFDRMFDPAKFNRDNPWFVKLWGEINPGDSRDQIGVSVTMSGESMVELLAFVGPTHEGYPLLMSKARFDQEYEVD